MEVSWKVLYDSEQIEYTLKGATEGYMAVGFVAGEELPAIKMQNADVYMVRADAPLCVLGT